MLQSKNIQMIFLQLGNCMYYRPNVGTMVWENVENGSES